MKVSMPRGARALLALLLPGLVFAGGCAERDRPAPPQAGETRTTEHRDGAHAGGKGADRERHDEEPGHKEEGAELGPERLRALGIVVAPLTARRVPETLRAAAEVGYDENRRVVVAARAGGWVEKVEAFADERVGANELLAQIYSPEFVSAQQEYLLIRERPARGGEASDATTLLADAEQRLHLLGLTEQEVRELGSTRRPYPFLHVHSPIPGTVIEHKLSAGDTVQPGQPLYVVADLSRVWASVSLTESQLARVRPGQAVTLTVKAYPERRFRGTVLSLGAAMDEATRTVKARAAIGNDGGRLKPGMYADAEITIGAAEPALALPEEAVLRNAEGEWVVYVEQQPGHFRPQNVKVARNAGAHVVIEGVEPGTRVVTRGAFFVQSELTKGGFATHNH